MDQQYVIGIDIGGTSTAAGLVDEKGRILSERYLDTQDFDDPAQFVRAVRLAIEGMKAESGTGIRLCGIGVGAPNGNFYAGRIEHAPNLPWSGVVDLAGMMEAAMGLPVVLTNDANAAALGEKRFGLAKGLDDFVVVTIGTGLGAGIVSNGRLIYGNSGFAGELGHTTAIRDGRPCSCGKKGCLESYVSARGLHRTFIDLLSENGHAAKWDGIDPNQISARTIFEAAQAGDTAARKAFDYTGLVLGRHLADLVAITSPEVIFLYGGLAAAGDLLLRPTREHFDRNLMQVFQGRVQIELSKLKGKSAAIMGAAALAWDVLREDVPTHETN